MLAQRTMVGKKTYDSFTKSMLHFNGANSSQVFTDEISKVWTLGGVPLISTTSPKFGNARGSFDGASWIDTSDHADFALGTADFTFDYWIKLNVLAATKYIFGKMDAGGSAANMTVYSYIDSSNCIVIAFGTGTTSIVFTSSVAISDTTTWHHVAVVRSGATFTLYLDGVSVGTLSNASSINTTVFKFAIGRAGEFPNTPLDGGIDEFRFSKGIARWTANFTPPTFEY